MEGRKERLLYIDYIRLLVIVLVVAQHVAVTYTGMGSWYYKEGAPLDVLTMIGFSFYESATQGYFMGLLFLIPLFIVVGFAIRILIEQTIVAIVAEDLGVFAAIERAWKLLVEKPWPLVVVGLATSIGEMAVMFVLVIPIFLVLIPFFISIFFQTEAVIGIGAIISGAGFLLYLPVMILASGILYAYIGSVWALTFKRLTATPEAVVVEPAEA